MGCRRRISRRRCLGGWRCRRCRRPRAGAAWEPEVRAATAVAAASNTSPGRVNHLRT
ncbi:hypothetical protein [Actinoallomurus sp. NBC_01490]|uniref:hypothetical protein n=1 Tax=Actinoallomurus sp. NBC_01490 TaxID=2903557 RepID=UPI003FA4222B